MNILLVPAQIVVFVVLWLFSFLCHEWCHSFEMWRQTGFWGSIHMNWRGLWTNWYKDVRWVKSDVLVWLGGGLYCSVIFFFLSVVAGGFFSFCFLMLGWCHLGYGVIEGCGFKHRRWWWYGSIIIVTMILWVWWFVL